MSLNVPFSSYELVPKPEKLSVGNPKSKLFIGIPKEDFNIDKRIGLNPEAVNTLTSYGHRILIESGAGLACNYSDLEYSKAGAEITNDSKRVFECPIIIKVTPPSIKEIELIKPNTVLWSTLQIKTTDKNYFNKLKKKRITAIGLDFIKDKRGNYSSTTSLSEIAGVASVLIASELMANVHGGKGLLMGNITGVHTTEVVVLGAGIVGEYAARTALGIGANVKIFDNSIQKLKRLQDNLPYRITSSTIQEKILKKALMRCDVAIGAIKGRNRAPIIVTESMVQNMKKGAIIMDISIDTGGCFETSELTNHDNPTVEKYGVIHYGVPNITSRYSRTASISISNIITPLLIEFSDNGGIDNSIKYENEIRTGIYIYKGLITNKAVAEWFDLDYKDIELFAF